ncbi:hypothetical protein ACHQM5_010057 [Ranunculus cassubicifolius]
MSSGDGRDLPPSSSPLEIQFEDLRSQLDESVSLRERIRAVSSDMESTIRIMQSGLLLVHQSRPSPQVFEKANVQIDGLKKLYSRLAEIIKDYPGQYYRYHGDWKSETQTAVSLIAFLHWLQTGNLLTHIEAEEKLGLTAGDYDCPRKVLKFLTDLHAAFRMLNLRNDFLRKKFDGMKYDLRRVEEVYYDVKIRGLMTTNNEEDSTVIEN